MRVLDRIYLEITNVCDLACPFCPPHSRARGTMPVPVFERIVSRLEGRANGLLFHVKGEPLLHPDLAELLSIAGGSGFPVTITTNGTHLESARASLAGKKNLHRLNVSLHSLAQFPGGKRAALMGSILSASDELVAENRRANPDFLVSYRLWTRDRTGETLEALEAIALRYGVARPLLDEVLAGRNGIKLAPGLALHAADTFDWPSLAAADFGERGFCRALRDHAGILVDGTVIPCCLDGDGAIELGNALTDDWDAIMDSPRARALYDGFTARKAVEPLCRRCGYRLRFGS